MIEFGFGGGEGIGPLKGEGVKRETLGGCEMREVIRVHTQRHLCGD